MNIKVNPDWWKELFDETYLLTDARSVCDDRITRREVDVICRLLPVKRDQKILDLCCGHGRHSLELYARGFRLCTLLDYSESLIHHARTDAADLGCRLHFLRADARKVALASASFDHVLIMGNSLGYIMDPRADQEILTEAYRLLKPGGWLLADVTDREAVQSSINPVYWHEIGDDTVVCRQRQVATDQIKAREMVLSKKKGLIRDKTYTMRLYDDRSLARLLKSVGFMAVEIHTDFDPHGTQGDYGCMNNRILAVGRK
jgi:D-alanine-D-alanine ligase